MIKKISILLFVGIICIGFSAPEDWGFFGHKKINRLAVFTLPPEMIQFYKKHIEFLTEESVAPDKRRYSVKEEAARHYIDIDHWGVYPFEDVPRTHIDAILQYADIYLVSGTDSLDLILDTNESTQPSGKQTIVSYNTFKSWLLTEIKGSRRTEDRLSLEDINWHLSSKRILDSIACDNCKFGSFEHVSIVDNFGEYGILPFHLERMQNYLTEAFKNKNLKRILRLSSEIGHYIGDAHVPLHTTENYDGQLTDQDGLHAFWESRLPELFADREYDFYVGKASYIENVNDWVWNIVLDSHALLNDVLELEKKIKKDFPQDQIFCYDERNERTVRIQCEEFSRAYHDAMDGMVERRMRDAVHAISSSWLTAWVDAGQPDLSLLTEELSLSDQEKKRKEKEEQSFRQNEILGRKHGQ